MKTYLHRVIGLYPNAAAATLDRERVVAQGLAARQIWQLAPGVDAAGPHAGADSDDVLKDLLRDGTLGAALGTALGVGVAVALWAAGLTLFLGSPLLSALTVVGWGVSMGAMIGALVGLVRDKGDGGRLIKEALASGQVVLVVHARTEDEATRARAVLGQRAAPVPAPHGLQATAPVV